MCPFLHSLTSGNQDIMWGHHRGNHCFKKKTQKKPLHCCMFELVKTAPACSTARPSKRISFKNKPVDKKKPRIRLKEKRFSVSCPDKPRGKVEDVCFSPRYSCGSPSKYRRLQPSQNRFLWVRILEECRFDRLSGGERSPPALSVRQLCAREASITTRLDRAAMSSRKTPPFSLGTCGPGNDCRTLFVGLEGLRQALFAY